MDDYDYADSPEASDGEGCGLTGLSLNGPTFCTAANLPQCIEYLQSALTAHGVSEELSLDPGPQGLVDAANALYALLRRLQEQVERTERSEEEVVKMGHTLKVSKQATTNLQAVVHDREKEVGTLRNQMSTVVHDQAGARDKASGERRELQRKCVDMESRAKRLATELKRKEQELAKCNAKLRELLESKGNQARHMRQLSTALSVHSRTGSASSVRSDLSDASLLGGGGGAAAGIQALKDTYDARYRELAAKHADLQTAYSRLQDTYKGLLFQQLRSGAKEGGPRYAAGDGDSDAE